MRRRNQTTNNAGIGLVLLGNRLVDKMYIKKVINIFLFGKINNEKDKDTDNEKRDKYNDRKRHNNLDAEVEPHIRCQEKMKANNVPIISIDKDTIPCYNIIRICEAKKHRLFAILYDVKWSHDDIHEYIVWWYNKIDELAKCYKIVLIGINFRDNDNCNSYLTKEYILMMNNINQHFPYIVSNNVINQSNCQEVLKDILSNTRDYVIQ